MEYIDAKIAVFQRPLLFLQHVSDFKELRDASTKASQIVSTYGIDAGSRVDVYNSLEKQLFCQSAEILRR